MQEREAEILGGVGEGVKVEEVGYAVEEVAGDHADQLEREGADQVAADGDEDDGLSGGEEQDVVVFESREKWLGDGGFGFVVGDAFCGN